MQCPDHHLSAACTCHRLRHQFSILSCEDLAVLVGVTVKTLADWRTEGKGPTYTKLGGGVFYRTEDIRQWINDSVVSGLTTYVSVPHTGPASAAYLDVSGMNAPLDRSY